METPKESNNIQIFNATNTDLKINLLKRKYFPAFKIKLHFLNPKLHGVNSSGKSRLTMIFFISVQVGCGEKLTTIRNFHETNSSRCTRCR